MRPIYILKSALVGGVIFIAAGANAQMDSCNIFLKGKYVEVGISPGGSYGSSVAAPAGYVANILTGGSSYGCDSSSGNHLGFMADPDMDGWSTGTPPFFGDYFLPGYPYEGWEIQVGSGVANGQAFNTSGGYVGALSGTNISYTTSGTTKSGTWQGTYDSIGITQITTIDSNSLYFTVKVILTNTSSSPVDNIYYVRAVDPDNAVEQVPPATLGGGFTTINKIEYQLPDSLNASVVSARDSTFSQAYLALGTTDSNARCYIVGASLTTFPDLADVYNETGSAVGYIYTQGATNFADVGIGLVIKVPHLASVDSAADSVLRTTSTSTLHPANTASFTYFYAFSKAAVDSAVKATTATAGSVTLSVKNVNSVAGINAYPNPARDVINITGVNAGDRLSLYDMMGRAIAQNAVNNQGVYAMPMNAIPAGAYIIVVQDANGNMKARIPVRKQ